MTPFLYLRSVTVYRELLREVEMQARRYGAAALQPPCATASTSTWRLGVPDPRLVPRQVMETLPSFNALIDVALGRCLNS